jgi:ketosteroid isomerase-like protein
MTADNVAILKEAFEHLERDGTPQFEILDPAIEMINFDTFPVTKPYHGWDGVVEWLVDMSEPFDDFHFELLEVLGSDSDGSSPPIASEASRGKVGPEFALVWGAVTTFRDGKIVRVEGLPHARGSARGRPDFTDSAP